MSNPVQIIIQGAANFGQINEEFQKLSEKSSSAFGAITKGAQAVRLFAEAFAVERVIDLAKEFSAEWIKSAKGLAQLESALKSTGQASVDYSAQLEEQRKAISAATGAEEDQIAVIQRHLVQYKASREQIEQLTTLSLDLAASQGMDGASAAMLLARSLGGQEVQLRGVRLEIDRTLPKYEQVNSMIRQLSAQVGGQARAAFMAASPEITRFNNELKETEKAIGALATGVASGALRGAQGAAGIAGGAFNAVVPQRIQNQGRSLWDIITSAVMFSPEKAMESFNQATPIADAFKKFISQQLAPDYVDPLHQKKMDILALQTGAGLSAAELPGESAKNATTAAQNEALYAEGKRSLQDYLNTRASLILKEADLEFNVLEKSLAASSAELKRKKDELDVVKGGTDLPQIETVQAEYDKLRIENEKLRSELTAAKERRKQATIGQIQLDSDNPTTFGGGIALGMKQTADSLGTVYQQLGATIRNTIGAAIDGISHGITGLITGTEKWGQALRNIGTSVLNVVIDGLVKMFAAEILGKRAVAATTQETQAQTLPGELIGALATSIKEGGWAAAAIWASAGAALALGVAAAAGAFAEGGRPPVGEIALVGERGPELFVPDTAGTIIPAHVTSEILNGGSKAKKTAKSGSGQGGSVVHVHIWGDDQAKIQKYIQSQPGQHAIAEAVGKNQHIILKPK